MDILRLLHILSAIFWVGSTLFITFFLEPTAESLGLEGGKFMQELIGRGISLAMGLAGLVTIGTGLWMYAPVSGGFNATVMLSSRLPLTLGALAGIAAMIVGMTVQSPTARKLSALGRTIATQGGPPTPEQATQMNAFQSTLRWGGRLNVALMILAVTGMVA